MPAPDAARRPGRSPERRSALLSSQLYVGEIARAMLTPGPISEADLTAVARPPRTARVPGADGRRDLALEFGAHVLDLVDAGRLLVRLGPDGSWYFRPAGWRSLTIDESTALVTELLNGASMEAA